MISSDKIKDKMLGCLYGQAIGNALGLVTEFWSKEDIKRAYPHGLSLYPNDNGVWHDDDTKQMLCVLDELAQNGRIIPTSLASRLGYWLKTDGQGCGYLLSRVLTHKYFLSNPFMAANDVWIKSNKEAAPNGGIMRTSVVGLMADNVEPNAVAACNVTHADPRCIGSCVIASLIIHNLIWNDTKLTAEQIKDIAKRYDARIEEWIELALTPNISALELDNHSSIGYTLRTLGASLWAYFHASDFKSGLVAIVNEGGDADTNAAVACAILGAKFGYSAIPQYYITNLKSEKSYGKSVRRFIDQLLNKSQPPSLTIKS